ncbi:von Willebrand factor-like [Erythrolamprus reginae]|uniref:von Willebrand factor-like n=1 Tax=Erythrolamprus reginae TaxID=121349 RepID=UPI00396C7035
MSLSLATAGRWTILKTQAACQTRAQSWAPPVPRATCPPWKAQCQVLRSGAFVPATRWCSRTSSSRPASTTCASTTGCAPRCVPLVQAYVDACQATGVAIQWRNSTFCPLPCPPNSLYSPCAPPCPPTCSNIYGQELCEKPPGKRSGVGGLRLPPGLRAQRRPSACPSASVCCQDKDGPVPQDRGELADPALQPKVPLWQRRHHQMQGLCAVNPGRFVTPRKTGNCTASPQALATA